MTESNVERDVRDHARILTETLKRVSDIENARNVEAAVATERREALDGRLDRIEDSIKQVFGLGKWILAGIGSTFLAALAGFVFKGGLLG